MGSTGVIATARAFGSPQSGCAGGIFADSPRSDATAPPSSTDRGARPVQIDFGQVFPGGAGSAAHTAPTLTLNLFPDVCVTAIRERATDVAPGQVQWTGRLEGAASGRVLLVIDGPVMVGTVRLDARVFRISYLGDGIHVVAEIDPSAFPKD
jgi:hypothetical protein